MKLGTKRLYKRLTQQRANSLKRLIKLATSWIDSLRRKKTHINKIRNEREVTTDVTEIQRTKLEYYERQYATKFNYL